MSSGKTLCAMLLVGLAVGSAQANQIVNGDFSASATSFTTFPGVFGDGANPTAASVGWNVGWGGAGVNGTLAGMSNVWGPTSLGGVTTWAFIQGGGKLDQEVSIIPGQLYEASFTVAQSHWDDVNPGRAQARLQIADGVSAGLAGAFYDSATLSRDYFQTFSVQFTGAVAPSGHWYLEMYNEPTGDMPGLAITNVSLSAIPEPSTLALLATGLIGLLAYAWRKRR